MTDTLDQKLVNMEIDVRQKHEEIEDLKARIKRLQKYIEGQKGLLIAYRGVGGPTNKTWKLLESLHDGDLDPVN